MVTDVVNTDVLESQQAPMSQFLDFECCVVSIVPWSPPVSAMATVIPGLCNSDSRVMSKDKNAPKKYWASDKLGFWPDPTIYCLTFGKEGNEHLLYGKCVHISHNIFYFILLTITFLLLRKQTQKIKQVALKSIAKK